ncbi:molybdopterin molybdotransferase MoeA [Streptomyces sp. NPDC093085]|uniref:molybdopterin molybdotransferase MoeA n=1 Tax=Streptomyces sp. NPDC093085 TaxID=3155068 RepID=UPI00344443FA
MTAHDRERPGPAKRPRATRSPRPRKPAPETAPDPDPDDAPAPDPDDAPAPEADDGSDDALNLVGRNRPAGAAGCRTDQADQGTRTGRTGSSRKAGAEGAAGADAGSAAGRGAVPGSGPRTEGGIDGVDDVLALVGRDRGREASRRRGESGGGRAAGTAASAEGRSVNRHRGMAWAEARALAGRVVGVSGRVERVSLERALGRALAEPLVALTDLPPFDTSAMDGWAVAGPGPWGVRGDGDGGHGLLAGQVSDARLPDGSAVRIATGARIPPDATAVVRSEHARTDAAGYLHARRAVTQGQDIRPRGQECRSGERLLPAGSVITPAVLGLAAAAGYDDVPAIPRPRVEVLVLGDELLAEGLPHDGLIRDALGPLIAPWLRALGADVTATRQLRDDAEALRRAVARSTADLVITTGGTAAGPVDHVHTVLQRIGAEPLVDGVAVRPGHPMLLARRAPGRLFVGLPGNPLAAVSGLLTLVEPVLRALAGRAPRTPYHVPVRDAVHGHPSDTRLIPFAHRDEGLVPLRFSGPAMLRGIAVADGLAVVKPGGARPGDDLEVLDLPWNATASVDGGCFT